MDDIDTCNDDQLSPEDQLAKRFYTWELRGRGWEIWNEPVEPEPGFEPFLGHWLDAPAVVDDGRKHTLISGLIDWMHRKVTAAGSQATAAVDEEPRIVEPAAWADPGELVELQVSVPPELQVSRDAAEQFLISLAGCAYTPAYEIIGSPSAVHVQFVCGASDADQVQQQLEAHFPEVIVSPQGGGLRQRWNQAAGGETAVIELGLSREFMLPLAIPRTFAVDPLIGVTAALSDVGAGEIAILQVMFRPVRHAWAESVLRSVTFPDGSPLFSGGMRDFVKQARTKIAQPLYGAVIRIACRSREEDRAGELAQRLVGALTPLDDPGGNELMVLDDDGYDPADHEQDMLLRCTRRGGMLLNSGELASLVHLPSASVRTSKFRQHAKKTKAAPPSVLNNGLVIGQNEHAGEVRPVTLSPEQRVKHMHLIGASGTGKSTLLLNMIVQDILNGEGVGVLDPHGDLIDAVLRYIPVERAGDVVLLDPSDEEFPVAFNILSAHSALEKNLLASDLVSMFRRLSSNWGDQMNSVLGNAILAFLESSRGGTLADLRRFLVEPGYRKEFLPSVQDPEVVYYWTKEFPLLTGRPQGPVLTRLDSFLRPKPIRYMVAQRHSRLDFADIMDRKRIFLARLSHGAIGEENAHLLGALIVSKFHQMALGRQQVREAARQHFWLYVDEFQNFATPSMASLLSGVRKYRLGLILAHQELHQLESKAPDVASAVTSNAYTRLCFRVGDQDAKRLESGFSAFGAADLQNLGTGEAIGRVERADCDFNVRTAPLPAVDEEVATNNRERIIRLSRQQYASARQDVEAELLGAHGSPLPEPVGKVPEALEAQSAPVTEPDVVRKAAISTVVGSPPLLRRVPRPPPQEPAPMGRGGVEHTYLQRLIKQYAEGLGYKAGIEENVLGGRAVDVALQKGDTTVACEICITTEDLHELGNVRKCLEAGYKHVAVLSPDVKRLSKLKGVIEQKLASGERERVRFFVPDELFTFLQELEVRQLSNEKTVRGYKVKTTFTPLDAGDSRDRRQVVAGVVARAMRRLRERKSKT